MALITTWRICAQRYADAAFSGEGARIHGGRWNSKDRSVVYASESISLAVLEQLVHVEDPAVLDAFVVACATLDEGSIEVLPASSLPDDWRTYPAPPSTRRIGDVWLSEVRSLALKVPSVTVRDQHNYLINPAHPDYAGIEVSDPELLDLDPRITGA
ncbi:MAG: RES domain-containing protein [Rubrobacteraceae bacterium]|nr:RES domain-containing protein [Rubrobacteraceae bacterium]